MVNQKNRPKTVEFGCHDTRRNLPRASSGKRGESDFMAKFEQVYMAAELAKPTRRNLAWGREFALDGFGRADVLFMAWKATASAADFSAISWEEMSITAIEGKLSDWRKGLMQASRYRYFANRSLLVLPPGVCSSALRFLETFRDLNVGLWQFAPETRVIRKYFTPRAGPPLNAHARGKAIQMISGKLKFR